MCVACVSIVGLVPIPEYSSHGCMLDAAFRCYLLRPSLIDRYMPSHEIGQQSNSADRACEGSHIFARLFDRVWRIPIGGSETNRDHTCNTTASFKHGPPGESALSLFGCLL
jgi:hypothetical protein